MLWREGRAAIETLSRRRLAVSLYSSLFTALFFSFASVRGAATGHLIYISFTGLHCRDI